MCEFTILFQMSNIRSPGHGLCYRLTPCVIFLLVLIIILILDRFSSCFPISSYVTGSSWFPMS